MSPSLARLLSVVAIATPVMGFCGSHTKLDIAKRQDEISISPWGYSATDGPLLWTSLDPELNAPCSVGTNQSPINLEGDVHGSIPGDSVSLQLPTLPDGAAFENIGSTVEVVMEGLGGSITLNDTQYSLTQFHFHNPSEHLDSGISMPMEMHMVFESDNAQFAVIGIFVDLVPASGLDVQLPMLSRNNKRAASTLLETVFASVGDIATPGTETHTGALDLTEVVTLVESGNLRTYSGSLTTPPCTENISWMVSDKKLTISANTFIQARNVMGFNSRYPQNAPGETNLLALASQQ